MNNETLNFTLILLWVVDNYKVIKEKGNVRAMNSLVCVVIDAHNVSFIQLESFKDWYHF